MYKFKLFKTLYGFFIRIIFLMFKFKLQFFIQFFWYKFLVWKLFKYKRYFKKMLSADEKQEALELIEAYRTADVPLIVPITLLNHFVRKYDQPYLRDQYYLRPHPLDLRLRSHC